MSQSTTVILTGHAQTQWNVEKRSQGHTDTPLNETGRRVAEILARRLMKENITAVYSSDLRRAVETARPFCELSGLPLNRDMRLREGRWKHQQHNGGYPVLPFPVEVETVDDVRRRIVQAMTAIAQANPGGRVIVISHGTASRQFIEHVLVECGMFDCDIKSRQAALNWFRHAAGRWECVKLGDDSHLSGLDDRHLVPNVG